MAKFKDLDPSVQRVFYAIGITFALLLGATYWTVKLAFAGHEAVMDPNYHEIGLNYEKTLASTKQMLAEGYELQSTLFTDRLPLTSGNNRIEIRFVKGTEPVSGAELKLRRERGATTKFTQDFDLKETSPGVYTTDSFTVPDLGHWVVTAFAKENDRTLRKVTNIAVQR